MHNDTQAGTYSELNLLPKYVQVEVNATKRSKQANAMVSALVQAA